MGDGNPIPVTERDALAAEMFPERWAKVATVIGKRAGRERHRLRHAAPIALKVRQLRAAGASCLTCAAWAKYPHGKGHVCDDESSGGTYTMAEAEGLCANWRKRASSNPTANQPRGNND